MSGPKGVFEEPRPDGLESRPTINLFEQWEGAHICLNLSMHVTTHSLSH